MDERIKIEAASLEEAYKKASRELGCSIADLDIRVLQHPAKGILGIGRKNAVILVRCAKSDEPAVRQIEEVEKKIERVEPKNEIFENFYKEKKDLEQIAKEVEQQLKELFGALCYRLTHIDVSAPESNTLLIRFDGDDAALLIGKEGYRYKALSYMLFNWLNPKYGVQIRLEIAEFLKSQEEMIKNLLAPLIERIKEEGRGQTKPLDGVLIQIALKQLREAFPDKYVGIRENRRKEKYIIVNEFRK
jgi:spoIIIJ-associated protein